MIIARDRYIDLLKAKRHSGKVKVITGLRRVGKSFLLFNLYRQWLLDDGVADSHIIEIALDRKDGMQYRNPNVLYEYVRQRIISPTEQYYLLVDEIQMSYKVKSADVDEQLVAPEDRDMLYTTFYDTLNELMAIPNLDIYVTGSNSKMLSKDIVTNFRDRGTEIRVFPLSFAEYCGATQQEKADAFEDYIMYGGMPLAVLETDEHEKRKYLSGLFKNVYLKDIVERYRLKDDTILQALVDALSSSVGSLSNPHKLANTASTALGQNTSDHTIKNYLDYLEDAFLFSSAQRYNIKGRKYFGNTLKYYATDIGLRNAKLNFRQQERSHLMENIIYNELLMRGYSVDVGVVEKTAVINGKRSQAQYEVDFVVNTGKEKIYIQSALNVDTEEKKAQETFSLKHTGDFFRKIVVLDGNQRLWTDADGVAYVGVIPFLLHDTLLSV